MSDLPLCSGWIVDLRPVLAEDVSAIARLRNASRQWFLDSREVDAEGVTAWLAAMRCVFPEEALLRIETQTGGFLGVAGWSHLCLESGDAEIGRLMVDPRAIVRELPQAGHGRSVAVDAVRAIGRYLFVEYGLHRIKTSFLAGNHLAASVNQRCGMSLVETVSHRQADKPVEVHRLELTRSRWLALQDAYASDYDECEAGPGLEVSYQERGI